MRSRWLVLGALAAFAAWAAYLEVRLSRGVTRLEASPKGWAERTTDRWPQLPHMVARLMIERYGAPQTVASDRLEWNYCWPWKRIVVRSAAASEPLEQVVDYYVPEKNLPDLERFGNGVVVYPEVGELAARSDDESINRLNLNLAHDIVTGAKTTEQAGSFFFRTIVLMSEGKSSPYLDRLLFSVPPREYAYPSSRARF